MQINLLGIAAVLSVAFAAGEIQAADWRRVGQMDSGGTTYYLDVDSPRRDADGQIVAAVLQDHLVNRKTPDGKAYASSTRIVRFDCQGERLADQAIAFYAEPKGAGSVVRRMERSAAQANADLALTDARSSGKALVYAACEVFARGKPSGQ